MVHITLNVTCYLLLVTFHISFPLCLCRNSLKYCVVNNVKQVQRKVNTTTPMTQAYQVYDSSIPSL